MYDGASDIQEEVRQNARDQQHPVTFEQALQRFRLANTEELPALPPAAKVIPGLSKRQMELINNVDVGQVEVGAARERRLQTIEKDITSIIRFLPKIQDVREYLTTMPHNDDEDLIQALAMADLQLRKLIAEVVAKLQSLEYELELKKTAV